MRTKDETTQRREAIDKIVDDILARAKEMISRDIPVETAFRLAISWELEITMMQSMLEIQKVFIAMVKGGLDEETLKVYFKPKTS